MFEKTRRQLTVFFSLILALILLVMTLLFYVLLSGSLNRNENETLDNLYRKLLQSWERHQRDNMPKKPELRPGLQQNARPEAPAEQRAARKEMENRRPGPGAIDYDFLQSNQRMAVTDASGNVVYSLSPRPDTPGFTDEWIAAARGRGDLLKVGTRLEFAQDNSTYMLKVYEWKDMQGLVLAATDITDDRKLLSQMRLLLLIFSGALLLVATAAGYMLAGKAMVPIIRSYRRQQEFTADASHELRTPLSVMQSSVEILEEEKAALPPFHQTVLRNMGDEVSRMIQLTESLLTLARSDSGASALSREPADLEELAAEAVGKLQPLAGRKRISLQLEAAALSSPGQEGGAIASIDPVRVRQLLIILLDNAIKYTPAGGEVLLTVDRLGGRYRIRVADNGIGIPKEQQPHIFERFYRVDKARSRQEGGAGLGLSIAKWIVEAHGGTISVESEPGKGSCFTVVLPAS